jgi:hypothetical protein
VSNPYDQVAEIYYMSGLWTIPVAGKCPPVAGATGYSGLVNVEKIAAWTDPDPDIRAAAGRYRHHSNVAIRHWRTLAIDVDHGYNDKDGVKHLAQFARDHDLPPLPATWSSTARGDDAPSRQYLYSLPPVEQTTFNTKPCDAVELCTWHHRYSVVYPSVHPDNGWTYCWYRPDRDGVPPTWGRRDDQIPRAESFAVLPREWLKAFTGTVADADRTLDTAELSELLNTFPEGAPDIWVQQQIDKYNDMTTHVGHDVFKKAGVHALLLGREGHQGASELFQLLVDRLEHYVYEVRPRSAASEVASLVEWVTELAQQKPLNSWGPRALRCSDLEAITPADEDTWSAFLATYTRYLDPWRLGRRVTWMKADGPTGLQRHAGRMVHEVIEGRYPADRALDAVTRTCTALGVTDPAAPRALLSYALEAATQ